MSACKNCKEYDKEKHCCPLFCKVIKNIPVSIDETNNTTYCKVIKATIKEMKEGK